MKALLYVFLFISFIGCANSYKVKVLSTSHLNQFDGTYFIEADNYNKNRYEQQIREVNKELAGRGMKEVFRKDQANMIVQFHIAKEVIQDEKFVTTKPQYEGFVDENTVTFNKYGTKIGSMKTSSVPTYTPHHYENVSENVDKEVYHITLRGFSQDNKLLWHTSLVSEGVDPVGNEQIINILTSSIGKEIQAIKKVSYGKRLPSSRQ